MSKVFIIAEAGSNWRCGTPERDAEMARTLIDVAAEAGADAVKFQTYRPETVYVPNAGTSDYLSESGIKKSITEIFKDLAMPYEMISVLAKHCEKRKIQFMSSVFSESDFKEVDPFVKIHKIASYEVTHARLLELAAKSGKPLVLSTGASTLEEIGWAVSYFKEKGGRKISLMQCTAKYPAPLSSLNLKVIPELSRRYKIPVGLSDHSRDPIIGPVTAVALGATFIEKHYTLDNRLPGPDHAFALTAEELKNMVKAVRSCESALGTGKKVVLPEEKELRLYAQRAIQATRNIKKEERLEENTNIAILRPGKQRKGIHPRYMDQINGKRAKRFIPLGDGVQKGDYGR